MIYGKEVWSNCPYSMRRSQVLYGQRDHNTSSLSTVALKVAPPEHETFRMEHFLRNIERSPRTSNGPSRTLNVPSRTFPREH